MLQAPRRLRRPPPGFSPCANDEDFQAIHNKVKTPKHRGPRSELISALSTGHTSTDSSCFAQFFKMSMGSEEKFTFVAKSCIHASARCRELAHLVGAKIWPTSAPNDYEKLGFYCNSRLYEMALDGHATLADKICLANDLKDRRDHDYAKALLTHILPGIPIWEKSAILHSDGLKDWLQSDPRGKWCSQNDKAFMYMVVRTFVMNIPSSMQKLDHTRLEDQFKGVDRVDHVISSWRGSNPEDLDALLTECIASQHNGPRSAIQPLDNSISPPECRMGGVGSPKQSGIVPVRVGDCLSLEAEPQQRKANDVGQTMSKLEAQQLSLALRDMHMDTIHRGQNRGRDAVMQRMRHMIDMQNQFVAKERHDYSSSALLCACRKEGPKGPAKPAIVLPSRNPPPTKKQPHGVFKHRRFDSRWGAHHVLNVHRMFMQNET